MYPRNAASPPFVLVGEVVQISDGALQTSGASARVKTGTGSWGAAAGTLACDVTSNFWTYTPTQAETDAEAWAVAVYKSGCYGCGVEVVTTANSTSGMTNVGSINSVATTSVTTVSAYIGSTGAAVNGTNANTLSSHDPGATIGTSTLTQTQVTGGSYALNSSSFAFNSSLDFTTTQKAATLARVTLTDTASTVTDGAKSATALSTATWTGTLATNLGTTNSTVATNLDATITSRMATYTQPTGFLAATFPSTVASTTNITAGTITTVTNLTNAPTSGDLTATMKASINTEVDTALSDYDAPTKAEMDAAFTEIKGATWATTDTLEAIRDRGDAAWLTPTGFSTHSAADVWAVATRVLTAGTNISLAKGTGVTGFNDIAATDIVSAGAITTLLGAVVNVDLVDTCTTNTDMRGTDSAYTGTPPTVGQIADQVWDEAIAGHAGVGSTGEALSAAGSAGDPWSTALPGAYGAGTAGKIIGDNIDAAITSRMATYTQPTGFLAATFPTTVASTTNITAASGVTLSSAGNTAVATAVEAAILDEGDATALLAAIAAKVEEFLVNEGDATATIAAIAAACNSAIVAGTVGTNVTAIKAKTDNLPASPASTTNITSAVVTLANGVHHGGSAATLEFGTSGTRPAVKISSSSSLYEPLHIRSSAGASGIYLLSDVGPGVVLDGGDSTVAVLKITATSSNHAVDLQTNGGGSALKLNSASGDDLTGQLVAGNFAAGSLDGKGDWGDVNVTQLGGSTSAATNLKNSSLAVATGTVATDGSNSATSFKVDATLGAKGTDYFGNADGGLVLVFISGTTNEYQSRRVIAFNATTDFITVEEAFSATPTDADTFILVGRITELS